MTRLATQSLSGAPGAGVRAGAKPAARRPGADPAAGDRILTGADRLSALAPKRSVPSTVAGPGALTPRRPAGSGRTDLPSPSRRLG